MTFREMLMAEHSREVTNKILEEIRQNPSRIDELMDCFLDSNNRICQRAAWPIGDLGEKFPQLVIPYMQKLIDNLAHPHHEAIKRNTVRTWQNMNIPEEFQGPVYDICFNYMIDPKEAVAIRAFSMTVCANICKEVPELCEEMLTVIPDLLENGSSVLCNRGYKVMDLLKKYQSNIYL